MKPGSSRRAPFADLRDSHLAALNRSPAPRVRPGGMSRTPVPLRVSFQVVFALLVLATCPDAGAQGRRPKVNKVATEDFISPRQEADGRWDADSFGRHDRDDAPPSDGRGDPRRDLRVTGRCSANISRIMAR